MKTPAGLVVFAGALVLATAHPVQACDCARPKPPAGGVRAEAPIIFEGQVVEILERSLHITRTTPSASTGETRPLGREVVFQVDREWAGVSAHRLSLFVDEGDCAFTFEAGHRYVVFAHRDAHGRPTTNVCTRTSESDHAQEVLKALGPPRRQRRAHH